MVKAINQVARLASESFGNKKMFLASQKHQDDVNSHSGIAGMYKSQRDYEFASNASIASYTIEKHYQFSLIFGEINIMNSTI